MITSVVSIVELVEKELLHNPAINPIWMDKLAIRAKSKDQITQELSTLGRIVLRLYPQFISMERSIMVSLYMWYGCLNIDKVCRKVTAQGTNINQEHRFGVHSWLLEQSSSNLWIKKGFSAANRFRRNEKDMKDYSWIPSNSPYWN